MGYGGNKGGSSQSANSAQTPAPIVQALQNVIAGNPPTTSPVSLPAPSSATNSSSVTAPTPFSQEANQIQQNAYGGMNPMLMMMMPFLMQMFGGAGFQPSAQQSGGVTPTSSGISPTSSGNATPQNFRNGYWMW